ncbi:MAG: SDR family oxidoreductase [Chloroflexi bacterium]|nr:SDR family oxidoreductase [Chloroflexota bacterium]
MTIADAFDFTGKTAVVTGGCGVLCFAIAKGLAEHGANVALLDRLEERGQICAEEIGPRAMAVYGDVLDRDGLVEAEAQVRAEFGPTSILVNCAGGNRAEATTDEQRTFFDLPADVLRDVLDVNLLGTIMPTQVFGRGMAERGDGVVVNISSMSAFRPMTRVPAYSAAKAAVTNFTQWLAVYVAQEFSPGVRVNAIAPGFFLTNQNRYLLIDEQTGDLTPRGQEILKHSPMGRFGTPDDLIGPVLWLASPAAAFVTGVVLPIDGGFNAYAGV